MKTRKPNQQVAIWSISYKWTLTFFDRIDELLDRKIIYIPIADIDDYIKENYGMDLLLTERSDELEQIVFKIYILEGKDYFLYRRIIAKINYRYEIPNMAA